MSDVVSALALVVSFATAGYAAFAARGVSHREVTAALIADYYASLRSLTELQLQEWRLSHLFEVAANYPEVVEALRRIAPTDEAAAIELRLKERAAAITIFGLYEHIIYQLREAEQGGDQARCLFLNDAATYFTGRLLANPRLRYLWSSAGGNLESEFEDAARIHFLHHVAVAPGSWDDRGPYS